ncbi:hypothetical protein JG687_00014135, partial [Phytophthora cactorum]
MTHEVPCLFLQAVRLPLKLLHAPARLHKLPRRLPTQLVQALRPTKRVRRLKRTTKMRLRCFVACLNRMTKMRTQLIGPMPLRYRLFTSLWARLILFICRRTKTVCLLTKVHTIIRSSRDRRCRLRLLVLPWELMMMVDALVKTLEVSLVRMSPRSTSLQVIP